MTNLFSTYTLNAIRGKLIDRRETIAIAESVTSGLLQWAFSQMTDAASFYQGGITVYNVGQKVKHLNVEPIHANEVNCVSQKVSDKMALEICNTFLSDWGIGITGYATPVPESNHQVFAWYAIAFNKKIIERGKMDEKIQDPSGVQVGFASKILEHFLACLKSPAY